jgi:lipoyl(octanoyl) transferase
LPITDSSFENKIHLPMKNRDLVSTRYLVIINVFFFLEEAILRTLAAYGVAGRRVPGAPGVYVGEAKIASLGLRIRRGASYHGLAFNVAMDLEPFARIDPCGYRGLAMTDLARLAPGVDPEEVRLRLDEQLRACLAESWARKARTQASSS